MRPFGARNRESGTFTLTGKIVGQGPSPRKGATRSRAFLRFSARFNLLQGRLALRPR